MALRRNAPLLYFYFVVTGRPGAGKTTLVEALSHARFDVAPESGRQVIREQRRINGTALPWVDPLAFAKALLTCDLERYKEMHERDRPVFFDRGIPDIIGYLHLEGVPVPERKVQIARRFRYRRSVFVCPSWPEIYTTDDERRHSKEMAERTYRAMVEVYADLNYELVEVPRLSVGERMRFVREHTHLRRQAKISPQAPFRLP